MEQEEEIDTELEQESSSHRFEEKEASRSQQHPHYVMPTLNEVTMKMHKLVLQQFHKHSFATKSTRIIQFSKTFQEFFDFPHSHHQTYSYPTLITSISRVIEGASHNNTMN